MREFKTINDIEDWLEPMDYQGFWTAIAPYGLLLPPKHHCDQQIRDGEAEEALVLDGVKYLARLELTKRLNLEWKQSTPWLKLVE